MIPFSAPKARQFPKICLLRIICLIMFTFPVSNANALSFADLTLKDNLSWNGQSLVLNGAGIRSKLFIKVYVGALYVSKKSSDADSLIDSDGPKIVELTFLRDLDGEKISNAFREGFAKNCKLRCDDLKPKIEELAKAVPSIKKGQILQIAATMDGVRLTLDEKTAADIKAADLGKEMIRIFIGKAPPTDELKKGLLGS